MRRLLWCLPLCLALYWENPAPPPAAQPPPKSAKATPRPKGSAVAPLPAPEEMDRLLARADPIAFFDWCLKRYDREVRSYRVTFIRKEFLDGHERKEEVIACSFRDRPFSVRMDWRKNPGSAKALLYVEGEYDNKVFVVLHGLASFLTKTQSLPLSSPLIKDASRFPVTDFGMRAGLARARRVWSAAKARGELRVTVRDEVLEQTGRRCWVLRRPRFKEAELDGVMESTLWIDRETWLLACSVETGKKDQLLGRYIYADVGLNPSFDPATFTRAEVAKAANRKTAGR